MHSFKSNSIHLCTLGRQIEMGTQFPSLPIVFLHTLLNAMNVIELIKTTFNNGSLGSRIDEERSELRYVM